MWRKKRRMMVTLRMNQKNRETKTTKHLMPRLMESSTSPRNRVVKIKLMMKNMLVEISIMMTNMQAKYVRNLLPMRKNKGYSLRRNL